MEKNNIKRNLTTSQALIPEGKTGFEYLFRESFSESRVWIRIRQPNGEKEADIGILFDKTGISVDFWDIEEKQNDRPLWEPRLGWDAFSKK